MRNSLIVAERELRSYFVSPLAYLVMGLFLVLSGYLFGLILSTQHQATLSGVFSNVSVLFLFLIPAISMRLLADEQKSGTIELLLTNPIQEWEIVVGKFVASVGLIVVLLILTLLYPIFLFAWGNPDPGPIWTGYLGVLLQASAFLAVGLWASALAHDQIVAYILGFALLLILWLSDSFGQFLGGSLGGIVSYLSILNHFSQFPQGVIKTGDVIYYLTVDAAGIILSTLTVQARRIG